MTDPSIVTYTIKELLTRLDERMGQLDQKLDIRLAVFDERLTHVERTQTERAYLVGEFMDVRKRVEVLEAERVGRMAIWNNWRFLIGLLPLGVVLGWLLQQYAPS